MVERVHEPEITTGILMNATFSCFFPCVSLFGGVPGWTILLNLVLIGFQNLFGVCPFSESVWTISFPTPFFLIAPACDLKYFISSGLQNLKPVFPITAWGVRELPVRFAWKDSILDQMHINHYHSKLLRNTQILLLFVSLANLLW